MKDLLPIGTVVLLKDAKKRLMIIGYCAAAKDDMSKIYDYSGCIYPEGMIASDKTMLFNHDKIDIVFGGGYTDEEYNNFKVKLNEIRSGLQSNENELEIPNLATKNDNLETL